MAKLSATATSWPRMSWKIPAAAPFKVWIDGSNVDACKVIATPNMVSLRAIIRSEDRKTGFPA
jgi:hypothetical protein